MAPELLQKGKMTRAADVYSFAMIMVELFTCKRLFEGLAQQQVILFVLSILESSNITFLKSFSQQEELIAFSACLSFAC